MGTVTQLKPRAFKEGDNIAKMRDHADQRINGMRVDRYSWWVSWRELAEYFMPRRYRWLVSPNQAHRGSPMNQRIINETGVIALRVLGAGMMAGITSPGRQWMRLTIDNSALAESQAVKVWLDEVTRRILTIMAESNYYNSLSVMYPDLGLFGSAPTIIYEDYEDVIRCYNPCAGEYFLANSDRLEVDTFAREFTYTMSQIAQRFGVENCSQDVQTAIRTGGAALSREKVICHLIEPNPDYVKGEPGMKGMPYREMYWEQGSSENTFLSMRGFEECPFQAPRWDISGNDAYGRSPGMDALPGNKQLQMEEIRKAQGIDKMVNPPMVADIQMKNQPASMIPGGVTYVSNGANGVGFKPAYEVRPDLQYMIADIQGVEGRIRSCLYYDLFLMISQLDTVRTATEIDARREEKLIQLGPVLERFQNEKLAKDVKRIYAIANRAGLMPPKPAELEGTEFSAEYIGMLAQAQRAVMTSGIERFATFVGQILGVKPEVDDNIDWDQIIHDYADMLAVEPKAIRPYAEVLQMRAKRAQAAAAAQQQAALAGMVEGAKTLGQADVGGGQTALGLMLGTQAVPEAA
tara:strand:- start:2005 stop:3735 length:1731 start_codon:yes stop_codon:yes gene_type:complete